MPSPPKTFTLFPLLPTEIRLMIFSYALPSPRMIKTGILEEKELLYGEIPSLRNPPFEIVHVQGPFPQPGLLGINVEARQLALKHYKTYTDAGIPNISICIDYSRDMFLVDWGLLTPCIRSAQNIYLRGDRCINPLYGDTEHAINVYRHEGQLRIRYPAARKIYFAVRELRRTRESVRREERRRVREEDFEAEKWLLVWRDGRFDVERIGVWQRNAYVRYLHSYREPGSLYPG